jgi:hypothetical protein
MRDRVALGSRRLEHAAGAVAAGFVVLAAIVQSSCLVTSTSDFPEPPQTPPYLRSDTADPPLGVVKFVDPTATNPRIRFSTLVDSEDQGVNLEVRLIPDDVTSELPRALAFSSVVAGTLGTPRPVSVEWDPRAPDTRGAFLSPGCHTVTLLVSHGFTPYTNRPQRESDQDYLVWFVFISDSKHPEFDPTVPLASCPISEHPVDAGVPFEAGTSATTELP